MAFSLDDMGLRDRKYSNFTTGSPGLFVGSMVYQAVVLCGVSGLAVIPIRCTAEGILFASGA